MDDLTAALRSAPSVDRLAAQAVADRAATALRPPGAFARLDRVAAWLAGWQRTERPQVTRPAAILFAGDHGVNVRGVSAYPATVTAAIVGAIRAGAATSSVLARQLGVGLRVVDVGVGRPTGDLVVEPAMDERRFDESVSMGRGAVAELDVDLLVLGEMGIGNTTAAAAVAACLFGGPVEGWVGRGTGIDDAALARKHQAVETARTRVGEGMSPLALARQVGGAELAALLGAAAEARLRSIPVVLDGFVVTAAVAPLEAAVPGALAHCLAGHRSSEPGHRRLLDYLGLEPLLDLDLRLGEGSGALLAIPLIRLAAACVVEVATFAEWGLSR